MINSKFIDMVYNPKEMLHHCRAVARGCKAPFLVADLPYGSYEASPDDAVRVSLKFLKEGNVEVIMNARYYRLVAETLTKYAYLATIRL